MRYLNGVLSLLLCFGLVAWVMFRCMAKSDDPGGLLKRWTFTVLLLGIAIGVAAKSSWQNMASAFVVPITGAVCGVILGIMWAPSLGTLLAKPFTSMFDGGAADDELRPLYSIAEARRKRGRYHEAIAEIRKQLETFPNDFAGWMMLAEIQAENLHDIAGAQETVDTIVEQPDHAPKNIAYALFRSSDWHLKAKDRAAAEASLQRILELLPDTEQSVQAAQKIAHLGSEEMIASQGDAKVIALKVGPQHLGIAPHSGLAKADADPAAVAAEYVAHLRDHPLDNEAREKLAVIYAEHYRRLDLAADQLEQLIAAPNQPPRQVAQWLNMLAELHIKLGGDIERARQALKRIADLFPNSAAEANALKRIAQLRLEMRANESKPAVKLGVYEQNIGLNGRS